MEHSTYEQGLKIRREILGDEYVDKTLASTTEFTADFQQFMTRTVWGDIWGRPGLDRRTKSCMMMMSMAALNRPFEFEMHVRAALRNGVTPDEIKEVLLLTAAYCGMPAANAAYKIASTVLAEAGLVADARPEAEGRT